MLEKLGQKKASENYWAQKCLNREREKEREEREKGIERKVAGNVRLLCGGMSWAHVCVWECKGVCEGNANPNAVAAEMGTQTQTDW